MKPFRMVWIFLLYLGVNIMVHFPFMRYPPCGSHVWRQCNTLAMARNFAEESLDITHPRIDRRNETNGVTGSHFPLYEWLLGVKWKYAGHSEFLARCFSLAIFTLAMCAFYLLLLQLGFRHFESAIGGLLLLSIPQFYYDSINAMPDILALMLGLTSCFLFIVYYRNNKLWVIVTAFVCAMLSGLVKPQFLIIPASSIVFINFRRNVILLTVLSWLLIAGAVYAWYQYALELTQAQNLKEFGLWIQPVDTSVKIQTIYANIISDVPELLVGWAMLLALTILICLNVQHFEINRMNTFMLVWFLAFLAFYWVAIERMRQHSYYFMAVLPVSVIMLLQLTRHYRYGKTLIILTLALNFAWAMGRIIPSRWVASKMNIPTEFIDTAQRRELENIVPEGSRAVIGPDLSGCIYFYFTHTKGYSFAEPIELLEQKQEGSYIEVMRSHGVKYLICQESRDMETVLHLIRDKTFVKQVGSFQVWQLD